MIESWELVEQDDMHDIAFAINFFTKHVFGINFNSVFLGTKYNTKLTREPTLHSHPVKQEQLRISLYHNKIQ